MQWHSAKKTFVFFSKTRMGRCAEKSIAEGSGQTSSFPRTLCKPEAPFGPRGILSVLGRNSIGCHSVGGVMTRYGVLLCFSLDFIIPLTDLVLFRGWVEA